MSSIVIPAHNEETVVARSLSSPLNALRRTRQAFENFLLAPSVLTRSSKYFLRPASNCSQSQARFQSSQNASTSSGVRSTPRS